MKDLYTIILAAGKGTRMKSDLPKVLHKINDKELVKYVIEQAQGVDSKEICLVVGYKHELVREAIGDSDVVYAEQKEQLGTGHAVIQAESVLKNKVGNVLILCGDVPLLKVETLQKLKEDHAASGAVATILTTNFEDPFGYGRIIKDENNSVLKIVEQKDASEDEKKITEVNSGVYIIDAEELFSALGSIDSDNAQNEYYLTDVIGIFTGQNKLVSTYTITNNDEILGINTLDQLAQATKILAAN